MTLALTNKSLPVPNPTVSSAFLSSGPFAASAFAEDAREVVVQAFFDDDVAAVESSAAVFRLSAAILESIMTIHGYEAVAAFLLAKLVPIISDLPEDDPL